MLIPRTRGFGIAREAFFSTLIVCLSCGSLGQAARAPSLDRTLSELQHTSWTAKDGVPGNIWALAQTTDGYLWLGGANGLYRFDGIRFEKYNPPDHRFPAHVVESLLATPEGGLFVGFRNAGASFLRNGSVTAYGEKEGMPPTTVRRFAGTLDGTIWAATNAGLFRFDGARWQKTGKDWDYLSSRAQTVFVDRGGILWVAGEDSVVYLPPGESRFHKTVERLSGGPHEINAFVQAPDGTIWMGETSGSVRPVMVHPAQKRAPHPPEIIVGSYGVIFDDAGSLWITSLGDGIGRIPFVDALSGHGRQKFQAAAEVFSQKDGLTSDVVTAILEDREGNIWVGTNAGLDRFRETSFVSSGLTPGSNDAILIPGDHGDLFTDSLNRELSHIDGRSVSEPNTHEDYSKTCGYRETDGTIWLGGPKGIQHVVQGRFINIALPNDIPYTWVSAIAPGRDGALWASINRSGVYRLSSGAWTHFGSDQGLPDGTPTNLYTDSEGRIWFGYAHGRLASFDGTMFHTFSERDGIVIGDVMTVYEHGPHLWIGGQSGLELYNGQTFRKINAAEEGRFNGISGMVETPDGDLWMNADDGILHVPPSEVRRALGDSGYSMRSDIFNYLDGLPGTSAGLRARPTAVQGTDDKIWFSVGGGVVWILPSHLVRNSVPPPVSVLSVTANGTEYSRLAGLDLPARTGGIRIAYEGLSLTIPERVRFRYKLDGVDRSWQDPGARREVSYTNLSPGHYRFHVMASNNDGVWNEKGTFFDFNIAPAWYQTNWFRFLCTAAGLFLLWSLYRARVRRVAAFYRGRMEERLAERERIARDLHDTLLQSVQGLILKFHAIAKRISTADPTRQEIEKTLDFADQVLAEGRDRVRNLRASTIRFGELPRAFQRVVEEAAPNRSSRFKTVVEGTVLELHPIIREETYCIGREALINALTHSEARNIEADITYDSRAFRLRIRDDGRGIDPDILEKGGRADHWGLQGMRERADRIGAKLDFWSRSGSGTEVELSIPAGRAYRSPHRESTASRSRVTPAR